MNVNKLHIIFLAALSLLLPPSCSVSHKQASEGWHYQTDSVRTLVQDSTLYQRLLQTSGRMEVRLHHITLSKPDSLGQQHPRTITVAELKQTHRLSQRDTLTHQSFQDIRTHSKEEEVRKEERAIKKLNFRFGYWIAFLITACCTYLIIKKKRKDHNSQ